MVHPAKGEEGGRRKKSRVAENDVYLLWEESAGRPVAGLECGGFRLRHPRRHSRPSHVNKKHPWAAEADGGEHGFSSPSPLPSR